MRREKYLKKEEMKHKEGGTRGRREEREKGK